MGVRNVLEESGMMQGQTTGIPLTIESLTKVMTGEQATDWMLPLFWSLGRKYPKANIGEIGMRGGTSTLAFLLAAVETGGHVWSMDIAPCTSALEMFADLGLSDRHTFLKGDSQNELCFPEPLDILFIDGDHRYAGVKADYERHADSVKDGGIVMFHDTQSCAGVGRLVKEIGGWDIPIGAGLGFKCGVPRNIGSRHLC